MAWGGTCSRFESFAAAAIHYSAVLSLLECDNYVSGKLLDTEFNPLPSAPILYHLSRAQQHVVYYTNGDFFRGRNVRFCKAVAGEDLEILIEFLIGAIPVDKRMSAIEDAMAVMTVAR